MNPDDGRPRWWRSGAWGVRTEKERDRGFGRMQWRKKGLGILLFQEARGGGGGRRFDGKARVDGRWGLMGEGRGDGEAESAPDGFGESPTCMLG